MWWQFRYYLYRFSGKFEKMETKIQKVLQFLSGDYFSINSNVIIELALRI